ncbi:MAG TPA: ATP-binding cassette domain-containing protein [Bdellovibrionales bacterium]|nr:ATP-binding cassette domain-containing protein [Bdellovibrionales bacterium]
MRNVSLKIAAGEAFVLIGPSGAGKSSLLKLMAGLLLPTSGEVFVYGKNLSRLHGRERDELLRKTGMLFQKNALFDSLSVGDNVAFPLKEVLGTSEKECGPIVDRYLTAVGIDHAKKLFPDEISGGMQKRLGIARALVLRPEIVFYDDPTAGLDPITSRKIIQLIKDLQVRDGSTVVAVTNDMHRAYQVANRIGMVVQNELIDCGTPEQTKAHRDPRVQQFIRGQLTGPLAVQA